MGILWSFSGLGHGVYRFSPLWRYQAWVAVLQVRRCNWDIHTVPIVRSPGQISVGTTRAHLLPAPTSASTQSAFWDIEGQIRPMPLYEIPLQTQ